MKFKIDTNLLLKTFLITMQGGNRRILDCIHMFWGCDFCHICGVFISTLDFLIACVAITSLVVWLGSAEGLELHPDEAEKWQTQIDDSFIALIISSCALVLSIIVNNCFLEKYSSWYLCCNDNSVYPEV